jgi:hypothetical protein
MNDAIFFTSLQTSSVCFTGIIMTLYLLLTELFSEKFNSRMRCATLRNVIVNPTRIIKSPQEERLTVFVASRKLKFLLINTETQSKFVSSNNLQ